MSRLNRDYIWKHHFGSSKDAKCLCCKVTKISRGAKGRGAGAWASGHVIHHKNHGPDIYENIRPICLRCNEKDKNFDDSYAYMVSIGTMTESVRTVEIAKIKKLATDLLNRPEIIQCVATTDYGQKCKNKKVPNSRYCGVHANAGEYSLSAGIPLGKYQPSGKDRVQTVSAASMDLSASMIPYLTRDLFELRAIHERTRRAIRKIDPFDPDLAIIDEMLREVSFCEVSFSLREKGG